MPTYSYACTACDNRFDIVQSFSDDSLTECPECTGKLRKLFNSVGVVFKGSGFYRTDSRGGSSTASEPAKSDSSSSSSSSSTPAAAAS
ncbi:FmdB family zinc ribbon protein [Rhodococcus sp. NPDC003382]|uniref:FmdB family zinc ribbon protein n=1 Tax=unclassified Rhodococcus (in: high G+C Gram-positive bacteria) TaxID=192944 RepID=UPI0018CEBBF3|nr:FmdB family zinc ribbon protein [Rhodococcus sp. CX]MBH0120520.1 FmdB family transcriptional regulator [Rhodococcus sp. CX]